MASEYALILAFTLGLFSTLHCLGMCGNIMGALTLSLPGEIRQRPPTVLSYVLAYNLGRVLTYGLLGLIVGLSGQWIGSGLDPDQWRQVASLLAAVAMILSGLYLTGWFPVTRLLEKLVGGLWRRIEPWGRRLLPIRNLPAAFLAGMVWGWLPCGLVYYALLLALTQDSAWEGGLLMLSFGLGTLPSLMATGVISGWLARMARMQPVRWMAGSLIILAGVGILTWGLLGHGHHPALDQSHTRQMQHTSQEN